MRKIIILITLSLFLVNTIIADMLIMNDDTTISGEVIEETAYYVVVKVAGPEGKKRQISKESIKSHIMDNPEGAKLQTEKNQISSFTAEQMKQQEYMSYLAIQSISKNTEDIRTMVAWQLGITVFCLIAGSAAVAIAMNQIPN